mmetsp:Transcript_16205/g.34223  ORF Transcript_16205/g.34223 Transcript_16205/m.34223 type:complete len:326 (-) Transcript_16205:91-1068(-)
MRSLLRQRARHIATVESSTNSTFGAPSLDDENMETRKSSSPAWSIKLLLVFGIILLGVDIATSNSGNKRSTNNIEWHWHHFSDHRGVLLPSNGTQRNLLIAQYTGFDQAYLEFTNITQKANLAYAKKWNQDYLLMKGIAYDSGKKGQAAYNKLPLLKKAMDANIYDAILILDSDAVIVDLDQDALDLIPQSMLLTACRNHETDEPYTWNVNNGVTIWNLSHEKMNQVYDEWQRRIIARMKKRKVIPSDQAELHEVLKGYGEEGRKSMVNAIYTMQLRFHVGTFVRHVVRSRSTTWSSAEDDLDRRKSTLQEAVQHVCTKWKDACD